MLFEITTTYLLIFTFIRQNGNQHTLKALSNWTNLVPVVEEVQEEKDLSGIPLEFLETPLPTFELMSYSLQMLSRRLDSNESDPSQVIRLCQRHSMMCLEEVSKSLQCINYSLC
jgi:hypothetical protein